MNEFGVMAWALALIAAALWKRDAVRAYRWATPYVSAWWLEVRLFVRWCVNPKALDPEPEGEWEFSLDGWSATYNKDRGYTVVTLTEDVVDENEPPKKRKPRRKRNPGK